MYMYIHCRISLQAPLQPLFEFHRSSGAQWFPPMEKEPPTPAPNI